MIGSDLHIDKKLWLKAVDDLQVQNNNLKEGLSRMLQQEVSPGFLSRLESFQTELLDKDAAMALLRYDIAALVRGLANAEADLPARFLRLGRDIISMEDELVRMKIRLAFLQEEIGPKTGPRPS